MKCIIWFIELLKKKKEISYWKRKLQNRGTNKSLPFPEEKEKKR